MEAVNILLASGAGANAFVSGPLEFHGHYVARNIPLISYAIYKGAPVEIAQELINYGADVNEKGMFYHWTPLMIAAKMGRIDYVNVLLVAGADQKIMNEFDHNKTAFDYAQENNNEEICELLQK